MAWKRFKKDKCEICGWTEILNCHHIIPRSKGGKDNLENTITICPNHHYLIHAKKWTIEQCKKHWEQQQENIKLIPLINKIEEFIKETDFTKEEFFKEIRTAVVAKLILDVACDEIKQKGHSEINNTCKILNECKNVKRTKFKKSTT